jgi:hypothetical protein
MNDPKTAKSNDFIVRLDGLQLDAATRHRIAAAIQATALAELGRLDIAGSTPGSHLVFFPKEWLGIWIRDLANLPQGLGELGKTLGVGER